MAQTTYKKQVKKEARDTFFLYVFFHSIWTGIFKLFED
tara:strand:+ start:307 stop:420 length:114 start_codon:yes stop_codon:yes gene_type:complete